MSQFKNKIGTYEGKNLREKYILDAVKIFKELKIKRIEFLMIDEYKRKDFNIMQIVMLNIEQ